MTKFSYINGLLVDEENACIGINDLAINRGYGVFDFCRIKNGVPLFVEAHLHRFLHSARQMHLHINQSEDTLKTCITDLIQANNVMNGAIKILATGGYSDNGYNIAQPNIIMTSQPLPELNEMQYEKGLSVITHHYLREMPIVKSINYTMGIWLLPKIKEAGADDVFYYSNGILHESPRSNIFVVTNAGEVLTPVHGILHGITRRNVLECGRALMPIHERDISMDILYDATEVFMTSTTKKIVPVTSIDGGKVGNGKPGPITHELSEALKVFEQEYLKKQR